LIPVDFSSNTDTAVDRAIELADRDAVIHLLHVNRQSLLRGGTGRTGQQQRPGTAGFTFYEARINEARRDLAICSWQLSHKCIEAAIIGKAWKEKADLVILGKRTGYAWLPFLNTVIPGRIAQSLSCPVLTVRPGNDKSTTRTIVVPVANDIPYAKINILEALCRKFRAKIYLTAFINRDVSGEAAMPLLKTYQWLRRQVRCPVEYTVLQGTNKPEALLAFARKSGADILLVHPATKSMNGWQVLRRFDMATAQTGVEVLTVRPSY
jgi:nucleotide-binding universal stress UspA family protein